MFTEVGSFDAKTKLPQLLRAIEQGERYTITLRGKPIADLVPSASSARRDVLEAITSLRTLPKISGIPADMLMSWIRDGRR